MRPGTPGFSGNRLRQARQARGLSESDLAGKLGVSRQRVSQYELGSHTPSPGFLEELASVLSLPSEYFVWASPGGDGVGPVWFRSLESTTRRAREAAIARFQWLAEIVCELDRQGALPPLTLPQVAPGDPATLGDDDIDRLAGEYRRLMGFENEPIDNLIAEVERRGVVVTQFDLGAPQMDAFSCWEDGGRPYIVLDRDRPAVRQRLDIAHELGHLVLHRWTENGALEHKRAETQAFLFGAELLFPRRAFMREVLPSATLTSLLVPKRRWKVSIKMMIRRAHALGVITRERMQQLFKQYSAAAYGRVGEPFDAIWPAESPALLQRAFATLLSSSVRASALRSIVLPAEDVESLCCLPPTFTGDWFRPAPPKFRPLQGTLF